MCDTCCRCFTLTTVLSLDDDRHYHMYYYPNLFTDSCTYVDKWTQGPDSVDDKISEYLHNPWPSQSPEHTSLISYIADMPYQTEKEQVILLSSISNYHWLPAPGISTDKISKDSTSRLDSQMVCYLKHDEDYLQLHQYIPRNHLPTSPCLRLLYLATNLGYEQAKTQFVCYLLKTDCPDTSEEILT